MIQRLASSLALAVCATVAPALATPTPSLPPPVGREAARHDYAERAFVDPLQAGLRHFYAREFKSAQADFVRALAVVPDNTLAISFLNAAAAQQPGALDALTNAEEDAVSSGAKNYVGRVRLGFSYMFQSVAGRDRMQDARDELTAAVALAPTAAAGHVGLGIMRFNERSANRSKTEFLAALRGDGDNVLAREYLGELYQSDLRDPARGLTYVIGVPNLVPEYADIHFHIGSILQDLHQPEAAIGYLKRGIALDSGHVGEAGQHGYTLLGRIYLEQRRLADARSVLDAAVANDVDTIYAKTLLAKIKAGDYGGPASPAPSASALPSVSATHGP
ncbi:MAG: hypothetical protein NVSMB21_08350 [Vulcanimicrobiaceae bacterium]